MQLSYRKHLRTARPRLLVGTALLLAFASLPLPARAQSVGDARTDLAQAATDYVQAEAHSRRIDADLSAIRQEIDALEAQLRVARAIATERAIDVYTGGSGGLETFLSSDSAIDAARRTELAARANTSAQDAIDTLDAATESLDARRAELESEQHAQSELVAELAVQRRALQARLARAQATYLARQTAQSAAAARDEATSAPSGTAAHRAAAPSSVGTQPAPSDETSPAPTEAPVPEAVAPPPPPTAGQHPHHNDPFLVCTRARESHGDYTAVNPVGYYGAYQMSPTTWDSSADHAGRPELIGVLPSRASVYDQDDLAWDLYQWQGKAPWLNRC